MELYVFDQNLNSIGIVDNYTSLIWAKRYNDVGDCEIYIGATPENIALLKRGYFIQRLDDDMICRIKKIELDTDIENGDYLIVTGYDAKDILNQRIIWNPLIFNGRVKDYILRIVSDAFNMDLPDGSTQRQIWRNISFKIASQAREFGDKDVISEQVAYENVGEKVKSLSKSYDYGTKVYRDGNKLLFDLYQGADKTNEVIFSQEYDNLLSTKYLEDGTNLGNVALVGGVVDGNGRRITETSSHVAGIDRYEVFVDTGSTSPTCSWEELLIWYPMKPGGIGEIEVVSPTYIAYRVDYIYITLLDNIQLKNLREDYRDTGYSLHYHDDATGQYVTISVPENTTYDDLKEMYPDKLLYFKIIQPLAANLTTATLDEEDNVIPPKPQDSVTLADVLYSDYLLNKGYEEVAKRGVVTSFDGNIEPSTTFKYKDDYDLGDLVKVENEYGITANARIVEIIETYDENGYSIMPKFEYMEVNENGN